MAFLSPPTKPLPYHVAVIGGGGTGAALAWDLSLRGFSVSLFETGELTSGTTGRHHGQLHSGARYAVGDRAIARECMAETLILRRLVPEAIEYNGGIFVALDEADAEYAERFIPACLESGIPAREIPIARALELEPALNPDVLRAVLVPDGSFDAFRLPLAFLAGAQALGARIRPWTQVLGFERQSRRLVGLRVQDRSDLPKNPDSRRPEERIEADFIVICAGAWSGGVGALAGVDIPVSPAAGAMLAVRGRLADMVLSRLRPPGDGDILVPQRGLSIIGTTQRLATSPEGLLPLPEERRLLAEAATAMVPGFAQAPVEACWCAARPLFGKASSETASRAASRDFAVLDHEARDGLAGLVSVVGGKATTLRIMAEKAADAVCSRLGVEAPCRSADIAPPSWRDFYRRRRS